jgi:hypothetical protein
MQVSRTVGWVLALGLAGTAGAQDAPDDVARVESNKQTVLGRVKRDPVEFRGDKPGEMRVRWEWWREVVNSYLYEKRHFAEEQSIGAKYQLRDAWIYQDMKVTFGELFGLGPEHDEALVPITASDSLLALAPSASFEGLVLLGKKGESKGPFANKLKTRQLGGWFATDLQFTDDKGKLQTAASGWSLDAYNVRWRDVAGRVADDMSAAKTLEDLAFERDAQYPQVQ